MYKPIIVQKSTRYVIAGNHTLMAAKALGWETIDAILLDVDNEQAMKILVMDNRSNDLATYDVKALGAVLRDMKSLAGTGYSAADVKSLTETARAETKASKATIDKILHPALDRKDSTVKKEDVPDTVLEEGRGTHLVDAVVAKQEEDAYADATPVIDGNKLLVRTLDKHVPKVSFLEIPKLRDDMLMPVKDLALNYKCYIPSLHRGWPDRDQGWLIMARPGNFRGLRYKDRVIIGFYSWDEYFNNWWTNPQLEVPKTLNAGFKFAMTPDFTISPDAPRAEAFWALYQQRWVGRYMQENGLKIIPNLSWKPADKQFMDEFVIPSLPSHAPVVTMEMQNGMDLLRTKPQYANNILDDIERLYNALKPEILLLYSTEQGEEFVRRVGARWIIRRIEPYANQLHMRKQTESEREILAAKGLT